MIELKCQNSGEAYPNRVTKAGLVVNTIFRIEEPIREDILQQQIDLPRIFTNNGNIFSPSKEPKFREPGFEFTSGGVALDLNPGWNVEDPPEEGWNIGNQKQMKI